MPMRPRHIGEVVLLCILALFLPPCAVACVTGCDINFALNLVFTLIGAWVTGVVHAWAIIIYYGLFDTTPQDRIRRRKARQNGAVAAPTSVAPPLTATQAPPIHKDVAFATTQYGGGYDAQEAQEAQIGNQTIVEPAGSHFKPGQEQSPPYARDDAWDDGPPKSAPQDGLDPDRKYG